MKNHTKITAGLAGALIGFCLLLLLLAPRLVNLESLKKNLARTLSERTGAKVEFETLDLSLFPRPRLTIHHAEIILPGDKASASVGHAAITLRLTSLLRGKAEIATLIMENPHVRLVLSEEEMSSVESYPRAHLSEIIVFPALNAPDMTVRIEKGILDVFQGKDHLLSFQEIQGDIVSEPQRISLDLAGSSCLRENLRSKGGLLDPCTLFTGNVSLDKASQRMSLELEARNVDLGAAGKTVLALAGDSSQVLSFFGIVPEGKMPFVSVRSRGSSPSELFDPENVVMTAEITGARVDIPDLDLTLQGATGRIAISNGVLETTDVEAGIGNASIQKGKMSLGLGAGDQPLHMDMLLDADLGQLPEILEKLVPDTDFMAQLRLVENLEGKAKARLVLSGSTARLVPNVEVFEFNLSASHKRIPYPVRLSGNSVSYDTNVLHATNLSGKVGRSDFRNLSGKLNFGGIPRLSVTSGEFKIFAAEFSDWLSVHLMFKGSMEGLRVMQGDVTLSRVRVDGPLTKPEAWAFGASGTVAGLIANLPALGEPVRVLDGTFRLDEKNLVLRDLQIGSTDTSLKLSGVLHDFFNGMKKGELDLTGRMGRQGTIRLSDLLKMDMMRHFQKPVDIQAFRFTWQSGIESALQARIQLEKGPVFSLEMLWRPERVHANRLEIQDQSSQAILTFRIEDNVLHASFAGSLSERTLESIFADRRFQDGSMTGDFQVDIPLDTPYDTRVRGSLTVKDFSLPWRFEDNLEIDSLSVEADGRLARLNNAHVRWGGKPLHIGGEIEFRPKAVNLDLDVWADSLRVEEILASAAKLEATPEQGPVKEQGKTSFPLRGTVRVKSETLDYGNYRWAPFDGTVFFQENGMVITVLEAGLCGIPTPGAVTVVRDSFELRFDARTKNKELLPVLTCLEMNGFKADGTFDLMADISARGKAENLLNELSGSVMFSAEKGRIFHSFLLLKVFAFLNLTEIFFGRMPDFSADDFAYDALRIHGQIQKGKLRVTEAVLDGDAMEMGFEGEVDLGSGKVDGRLLVAPLRTVDRIVRHIPLLGRITGGTLVSIPIRVTGDLNDLRLTPLSPSAIGQGLVNTMRRTFNLPVDIIDSFRPDAAP